MHYDAIVEIAGRAAAKLLWYGRHVRVLIVLRNVPGEGDEYSLEILCFHRLIIEVYRAQIVFAFYRYRGASCLESATGNGQRRHQSAGTLFKAENSNPHERQSPLGAVGCRCENNLPYAVSAPTLSLKALKLRKIRNARPF